MATQNERAPVSTEELLVSSLAQTDALAKLLIEKGIITQQEFLQKIAEERTVYQKTLNVHELEKRMDALSRDYATKPDPKIIAELNELSRRLREMKE